MPCRTALSLPLLLLAVACTGTAGAGEGRSLRVDRDELVNTGGWTLTSASGGEGATALRAPGIEFTMTFTRGEVSASGGCNQLRGTYTASGKRMQFDIAIATRMSCTDDRNLADRSFVELLNREFKAELLEPMPYRLRLTADTGEVLEFQSQPLRF